ncbi:uncharacterized protein F13E9.13, mitochondrial isoform X5 [Solenopsis invicta]|uniref:uncharacterized protein F13E9.13, mitochondrial isoform X5 n=1 Tax=Solenopsis invicta TaxID=13686 RepID=UPI00193E56DC|nr:uncharacterized protein F13E9.13, mitochondrial isoform X5 [Solenopsis invicta]
MRCFRKLFPQSCSVIGMVHVKALPGTPKYEGCSEKIVENATKEALIYADCSVDGILIENMHDVPYIKQKDISPEITTMMTRICTEIRKVTPQNIACGVQILAGCNKEAIAVAKAAGLQFIRAEGFVFSHVADEGFIDSNAGTLLRYRRQIDADNILVFVDVKKKHSSHIITSDVSLLETVKAAEFFLADGVILTGKATGEEANMRDLLDVRDGAGNRNRARGVVSLSDFATDRRGRAGNESRSSSGNNTAASANMRSSVANGERERALEPCWIASGNNAKY